MGSIVKHGVGGPEAGAINIIYRFLLHEFDQELYKRIGINQIGEDLEEFVSSEPGNKVYVNIRYPVYEDFESKSIDEKNRIRLDVIHIALLRIAQYDGKLDIQRLESIKERILANHFQFEFTCKSFICPKNESLVARIVLAPQMAKFDFHVIIEHKGEVKCRLFMYSGLTDLIYFRELFSIGKWRGENEFVSGESKNVEIIIFIEKCEIQIKNLTGYSRPPYFDMMRADISEEDREKAYQDWRHSLPPAIAAALRRADN